MTPLISTRLAALSPRPDSASIAGSRSPEKSPGANLSELSLPCPSRLDPATPGDDPPSFLDSNPSDPMTPDPTHYPRPAVAATVSVHALISDNSRWHRANLSNQKITLPP